jgi:predicted MPP superfamily phosphohydrolase
MNDRGWKTLAGVASMLTATGVGMLVYGAVGESNHLVVEHQALALPGWPDELKGYRVAVLGDFHIGTSWSVALAQRAISAAMAEAPDMVLLVGDFVNFWKTESASMVGEALESLRLLKGDVIAIAGNHDYYFGGDADLLAPILDELGVVFLRNESIVKAGITWVGIDSAREKRADVDRAFRGVMHDGTPKVVLWHEPDVVDQLPTGCALQLSGHSHGGQFRLPLGITPMHSPLGQRYPRGFYPSASTPLFVTRGVGTTGPPSRFLCPPEVAILTLLPG